MTDKRAKSGLRGGKMTTLEDFGVEILVKCNDCGLNYGAWHHKEDEHYDPTQWRCESGGCYCGSDDAWGFCSVCLAEIFGGAKHSDDHSRCSPYNPKKSPNS